MIKKDLLDRVAALGYVLIEPDLDGDVEITLAEVVLSEDARLWEGFPVVLATALRAHGVHLDLLVSHLKRAQDKNNAYRLLNLARELYRFLNVTDLAEHEVWKTVEGHLKWSKDFQDCLILKKNVSIGDRGISPVRLIRCFEDYKANVQKKMDGYLASKKSMDLERALSEVFSKKQKELFLKKLKHEVFTKTEREYYSRVVKKKVHALANSQLHAMALSLISEM